MRARILSLFAITFLVGRALAGTPSTVSIQPTASATRITWADTSPLRSQLESRGLTATSFPAYIERLSETHTTRVRLGDLDHLVFYLLQSKGFTTLPPIEPALSAKALVEGLGESERESFLRTGEASLRQVPSAVRDRIGRLLVALGAPTRDPRLIYFGELINAAFPDRKGRETGLAREYLRAMRFVYEKEFVAQRSAKPADAVADLYRSRGLSTDTAVEAGYVVSIGLGILKSLQPERSIRRVLIVGPGLDLAPRTALLEAGPPESYQPWAVMDALVSYNLARLDNLEVVAADINPRVVAHLKRATAAPPTLTLVSEIGDSETVALSAEYRDYFVGLGRSITDTTNPPTASKPQNGHLRSTVPVGPAAARALSAETLDIVTERLASKPFDLVIATNILPYFDDGELTLAISNIAAMLAPGGIFLHNESRPIVGDLTAAVGLPFEQSRHVVIATVRGAQSPLYDSVYLHRKIIRGAPPLGLPYWLARGAPTPRSARQVRSLHSFAMSPGSFGR